MDALLLRLGPFLCLVSRVPFLQGCAKNRGVGSVECKIMSTVKSPWSLPVDFSHPGS